MKDETKEFKKDLRSQLKDKAFMKLRKNLSELSNCETKVFLNEILKDNQTYWKHGKYGTTEEYKQVFRETFPKELKKAKQRNSCVK